MRVHRERPYMCSQCDYRSTTSVGLKCHYKVHSGEALCKCSKSFKFGQLKTRKHFHAVDRTYRCPRCSFRSDVPEEIAEHSSWHHNGLVSSLSRGVTTTSSTGLGSQISGSGALTSVPNVTPDLSHYSQGVVRSPGDLNCPMYLWNLSALSSSLDARRGSPSVRLGSSLEDRPESTSFNCRPELPTSPGSSPTSSRHPASVSVLNLGSHFSPTPFACIFCDHLFSDMNVLKTHLAAHSDHPNLGVSWPKLSVPFSFLDGFFPPNHLSDIHWNDSGMPSRFNCFFSMFFGDYV